VREYTDAGRAGYAAQLLRNAGRRQEAALLYQKLNQADQAAETLVEDGKYAEAAHVFMRMGKLEVAASVLKQGGQWAEAAALYEQTGNTALAADLYAQAGQMARALALYEQLQDWHRVAELAEATDDAPRLANALTHSGQAARAAETYERTGLLDRALDLYRALAQWDKVRQIAGQLEQWERQAEALEKIGLVSEAGEAYERAAAQAQTRAASPEEIARLYELAAHSYANDENWNRQQSCWDQVCRYRQWPNLRGRFELADAFYENEYNQVRLALRNVGYDVARNVCVSNISSRFKWDSSESDTSVPCVTYLAPQQDKTILLSLQPRPSVLGRVNLRIKLSYEDKAGQTHENEFVQSVEVLGRDEKMAVIARQTPTGITPPGDALREDRLTESVLERPRSEAELKLYNGLVSYFNEEELRDLCFQLGIDYETLPGDSKTIKARELVTYHERRNRIESLSQVCRQLRPNVSW
jgi:tetratricopeptide (TPR) repeat protein